MLDKRTRGAVWLAVVLLENVAFVVYLQRYTQSGRGLLFGLPESFVVLVGFVFLVTAINAGLGWYYLGKPDLSGLYSTGGGEQPTPTTGSTSEAEGS